MKKNIINKKNILIIVAFIFILASILFSQSTYGRYVINKMRNSYLTSRKFYFDSKALAKATYTLYNYDGVGAYVIPIDLTNSVDNLNWTSENINYTVTTTCTSPSGLINCTNNASGTLMYNRVNKTNENFTISVSPGIGVELNDGDIISLVVIIESTSPYKKTLMTTYTINIKDYALNYYIVDNQNQKYLDLIINNNTLLTKNLQLAYNKNILIYDYDNTINGLIITDGNPNINITGLSLGSHEMIKIRFYKNTITNNYSYPIINNDSIITVTET